MASMLWSTSMTRPCSSGRERLEGGELRGEQRGRHEVARAAGLAPGDHLGGAVQVHELRRGGVVAQLVAVGPLERRAAHHPPGSASCSASHSPIDSSHGCRSSSSSGVAGASSWRCWPAGGSRRRRRRAPARRCASAAPTVDLPEPETPMTTTSGGTRRPVARVCVACGLREAAREAAHAVAVVTGMRQRSDLCKSSAKIIDLSCPLACEDDACMSLAAGPGASGRCTRGMLDALGGRLVGGDLAAGRGADAGRHRAGVRRLRARSPARSCGCSSRWAWSPRAAGSASPCSAARAWNVFDPRLIRWRLGGRGPRRPAALAERAAPRLRAGRRRAGRRARHRRAVRDARRGRQRHGRARPLRRPRGLPGRRRRASTGPCSRPAATRCSARWPTSSAEVLAGRTHHDLMPARPNPEAIALHDAVARAVRTGDARRRRAGHARAHRRGRPGHARGARLRPDQSGLGGWRLAMRAASVRFPR